MPRPTDWVDTRFASNVLNNGNRPVSLLTGMNPVDLRGSTLIRTIIALDFASETVAGAWGVQHIDLAIGIASQESFAADVLPDPDSSSDKPSRGWIYRTALMVAQNSTGSPVVYGVRADVRGSRKIENGELFITMDNNAVQGTSFTVLISGVVRCLIKLA